MIRHFLKAIYCVCCKFTGEQMWGLEKGVDIILNTNNLLI